MLYVANIYLFTLLICLNNMSKVMASLLNLKKGGMDDVSWTE